MIFMVMFTVMQVGSELMCRGSRLCAQIKPVVTAHVLQRTMVAFTSFQKIFQTSWVSHDVRRPGSPTTSWLSSSLAHTQIAHYRGFVQNPDWVTCVLVLAILVFSCHLLAIVTSELRRLLQPDSKDPDSGFSDGGPHSGQGSASLGQRGQASRNNRNMRLLWGVWRAGNSTQQRCIVAHGVLSLLSVVCYSLILTGVAPVAVTSVYPVLQVSQAARGADEGGTGSVSAHDENFLADAELVETVGASSGSFADAGDSASVSATHRYTGSSFARWNMVYLGIYIMWLQTLWVFTHVLFADDVTDDNSGWFSSLSRPAARVYVLELIFVAACLAAQLCVPGSPLHALLLLVVAIPCLVVIFQTFAAMERVKLQQPRASSGSRGESNHWHRLRVLLQSLLVFIFLAGCFLSLVAWWQLYRRGSRSATSTDGETADDRDYEGTSGSWVVSLVSSLTLSAIHVLTTPLRPALDVLGACHRSLELLIFVVLDVTAKVSLHGLRRKGGLQITPTPTSGGSGIGVDDSDSDLSDSAVSLCELSSLGGRGESGPGDEGTATSESEEEVEFVSPLGADGDVRGIAGGGCGARASGLSTDRQAVGAWSRAAPASSRGGGWSEREARLSLIKHTCYSKESYTPGGYDFSFSRCA